MPDGPIAAIHRNDLHGWAVRTLERAATDPAPPSSADVELAGRARAACASIGERRLSEHRRVADLLTAAGVDVEPPPSSARPAQRIEMTVEIGLDDLETAIDTLAREGYRRHQTWGAGAERSLRRVSHEIAVARSDDVTHTVRLRWRAPRRSRAVARMLTPTPADWATVDLPSWAWWGYRAVRPVRLVAERLGLASRDHADLEPFLVTPTTLVPAVLDAAGVGPDDRVLDLGCGDGRILIVAAQRFGCRALGIEQSPERAAEAVAAVEHHGLGDLVEVVEGDGLDADLAGVTVAMLFLPTVVVRRVLPALLSRLDPGARVVLHEQSPLHGVPEPDRSVPIVTDDAVTVAHRWNVA